MEHVLHKPTPPPNEDRWHIVLQGHPLELLDVLNRIAMLDANVIQTAEWLADDELLICLKWIDDVIPRFIQNDVSAVSDHVKIKRNGRERCY